MALDPGTALLHAKIAAVCPIDGIRIGDPADVSTWLLWPSAGATAQQIAAGQAALAAITPASLATAVGVVQAAAAAMPDPLAAAKQQALAGLPAAVAKLA